MRRILFVAELGGGYGHVKRLLPIARVARLRGYRPVFLVPNPAEVAPLVERHQLEVGPVPTAALKPTRPRGAAATYADVLGAVGFDEPALLRRATALWEQCLAQYTPAALICEMSPFLNLTCFGSGWPCLVVGHGFGLPPPHRERFSLLWPGKPLFSEPELLAIVQDVCRARARPAPQALPALLGGSQHAVTGLEALDPYRFERLQPAAGPPGLELRGGAGNPIHDVFAYLSGASPLTLRILVAIAASGLSGRVFVRGAQPSQRRALEGSRVRWLEQPDPGVQAICEARCIVHHAGMLTAEEALLVGRPQVVAPLYLENLLTTKALAELGVAAVLRPTHTAEELKETLLSAASSQTLTNTANHFAATQRCTAEKLLELPGTLLDMIIER